MTAAANSTTPVSWRRMVASPAFTGYALMLPAIVCVGIFLAAGLFATLVISFWTQSNLTLEPGFTLDNYVAVFSEPRFRVLFARSLVIALATTIGTITIAYPVAYFLAFYTARHRTLWIILITIPFWLSYLLRVFSWKIILGYNGVINSGLKLTGLVDEPLTFLVYSPAAIVITLIHAYVPFAILPLFVSLEKIDRSYLEAATDLGDTPFERFVRVILPLSLPGVLAATLLIFIPTVGDYVTPQLVGGPDGLMIANLMQSMFGNSNNWPLGSALAIASMLLVGALAILFSLGVRRMAEQVA